jgi:hypothetical protein
LVVYGRTELNSRCGAIERGDKRTGAARDEIVDAPTGAGDRPRTMDRPDDILVEDLEDVSSCRPSVECRSDDSFVAFCRIGVCGG